MSLGPLADNLARIAQDHGPPAPGHLLPWLRGKVETWLPDPGEEAKVDCATCGQTLRSGSGPSPGPDPESDAGHLRTT